jgi:hypothetical protein
MSKESMKILKNIQKKLNKLESLHDKENSIVTDIEEMIEEYLLQEDESDK